MNILLANLALSVVASAAVSCWLLQRDRRERHDLATRINQLGDRVGALEERPRERAALFSIRGRRPR